SKSRDKQAAKCFFKKALAFSYVSKPRVITVDKNLAYPVAIQALKGVSPHAHQPKKSKYPKTRKLTSPDENVQFF
ncbi:transposase, partial [Bacillus gaemokensis]